MGSRLREEPLLQGELRSPLGSVPSALLSGTNSRKALNATVPQFPTWRTREITKSAVSNSPALGNSFATCLCFPIVSVCLHFLTSSQSVFLRPPTWSRVTSQLCVCPIEPVPNSRKSRVCHCVCMCVSLHICPYVCTHVWYVYVCVIGSRNRFFSQMSHQCAKFYN